VSNGHTLHTLSPDWGHKNTNTEYGNKYENGNEHGYGKGDTQGERGLRNGALVAPSEPSLRQTCEVTPTEAEICRNHHRALAMLVYFRQTYGTAPFPCVPETIGPILCMNHKTARQERDFLLRAGLIETSHVSIIQRAKAPGRKPVVYTVKPLGAL
jgi:hypothetical protein